MKAVPLNRKQRRARLKVAKKQGEMKKKLKKKLEKLGVKW